MIHRDIKPENILMHGGHALVADFGIALAASTTAGARMTGTGMSLGTPTYMSPEQAMGERDITSRSDVYALGCVLYEAPRRAAVHRSHAQSIIAKVLSERPAPMRTRRDRIPPRVEAAVLTALESLGISRIKLWHFRQADGTALERWAGFAYVYAEGLRTADEVIFGEPGDMILFGARTLEGLNLRVDAHRKILVDAGPAPAACA